MPRRTAQPAPARPPSPVYKPPGRAIPHFTRLTLYVRAGGRCEFDGCNHYLLEHHVTTAGGNFAEMAHIWAYGKGGPRSRQAIDKSAVHDISNLMLLCPGCHKLVDDRPAEFTEDVLRSYKKAHEDRIFQLTDTKPDRHTVAVVLRGHIAGRAIAVSLSEIQAAIAPRYCGDRSVHEIDLMGVPDGPSEAFWRTGAEAIRKRMSRFYDTPFDHGAPHHVSIFALAPIPLLMVLGSTLSDKVPTALFQRHRDTESWVWKREGATVEFETHRIQDGSVRGKAAILLCVSGSISISDLPPHVDAGYAVYVLSPRGANPNPTLLAREESLQGFRSEYQRLLRRLLEDQPGLKTVDLFPAVPAPAAVAMGRDLLPKRDPVLVVYDFDRANGGFVRTLEVNAHDE